VDLLLLIPAVFGLVWLALRSGERRCAAGRARRRVRRRGGLLQWAGAGILANFAKLAR
jgi:hypothetical protein